MADPPKTRPYYPTSVKLPNLVAVRQKVRTYIEMSFARKMGQSGPPFKTNKVIESVTVRSDAYDFLLVIRSSF